MKAGFILPSCNYNIVLTKEELEILLSTGHIDVNVMRDISAHTGRYVYDNDTGFKMLDRKSIPNNLRFYLEDNVADIEGGDWHIQFLTINIEGFKKEKN